MQKPLEKIDYRKMQSLKKGQFIHNPTIGYEFVVSVSTDNEMAIICTREGKFFDVREGQEVPYGNMEAIILDRPENGDWFMGRLPLAAMVEYVPYVPLQLCPKCKGAKFAMNTVQGSAITEHYGTCDICNGDGVIPMHPIESPEKP